MKTTNTASRGFSNPPCTLLLILFLSRTKAADYALISERLSIQVGYLPRKIAIVFTIILALSAELSFAALPDVPVDGDIELYFTAIYDDQGNFSSYRYDGSVASDSLNANLPVIVPIGISSLQLGQPGLYWSEMRNWSGNSLQLINFTNIVKPVISAAGGAPILSLSQTWKAIDSMQNGGPTERSISTDIVDVYSQYLPGGQLSFGAGLDVKFDVTLQSTANVIMDQSDVVLEKLTLDAGANLTGNSSLVVRTDLVNHGFFGNLAGTIEGNFINDGNAAQGNRALVDGNLYVQGQLSNTGEIWVNSGRLNLAQIANNGGSIVVNGGSIQATSGFTNLRSFELRNGGVSATGGLVNFGDFEWLGGQISGGEINQAGNFTISGSGSKTITDFTGLSNSGTINHVGDAVVTLEGRVTNSGIRYNAKLNNLAGGLYDLQGDGDFQNSAANFGSSEINNAGTFRKSGGTGESVVGGRIAFNNTGTVEVDSGVLSFMGGGSVNNGAFTFSNGGTTRIAGGIFQFNGTNTVSGNGAFEIAAGTVRSSNTSTQTTFSNGVQLLVNGGNIYPYVSSTLDNDAITLATGSAMQLVSGNAGGFVNNGGAVEWTGGNITATATNQTGVFTISDVGTKKVTDGPGLSNSGTINHVGDAVVTLEGRVTNSGIRYNAKLNNLAGGLYDLQGDGDFQNSAANFGSSEINNAGTFRKSGGTGESVVGGRIAFNNTGTVEVDSGTLKFDGNFATSGDVIVANGGQLARSGNYVQTGGTTQVDGVLSATGRVDIQDGQLSGSGIINTNLTNAGLLGPGNSPGLLSVIGDYTQESGGSLLIEIGGLLSGDEYDVLDVTGTASLGGTLDVSLWGDFNPFAGNSFDILLAETIAGEFDLLSLPSLTGGVFWEVNYLPDFFGTTDIVRLNVVSTVPIPPAIWLFGSGLIGFLSFGRRPLRGGGREL